LAFDGKLLGQVLRIFIDTVASNYRKRLADRGIPDGECGRDPRKPHTHGEW
jgi:hypothetical protein